MINELMLATSVVIIFGAVLLLYYSFGKAGLLCALGAITILANIEVSFLVRAFSMEQTLGNVLFASTFLITDILSENEGKRAARTTAWLGVAAAALFLVVSRTWFVYVPSENDLVMSAAGVVFGNTLRILAASFVVFALCQLFDVWLYHRLWDAIERRCGDRRRFLWVRNITATITSQLLNTSLFTVLAFWGVYDGATVLSIFLSSFAIYVVLSFLSTPVVYAARKLREHGKVGIFL